MMFKIIPDKKFFKNYKKLSAQSRIQVDNKLLILTENPNHPSLRTKRIKGTKQLYESSVNMDIRLIWHYEDDKLIILLDIGHHDILRQC